MLSKSELPLWKGKICVDQLGWQIKVPLSNELLVFSAEYCLPKTLQCSCPTCLRHSPLRKIRLKMIQIWSRGRNIFMIPRTKILLNPKMTFAATLLMMQTGMVKEEVLSTYFKTDNRLYETIQSSKSNYSKYRSWKTVATGSKAESTSKPWFISASCSIYFS